jgi:hypothetical protein
MFLEVSNNRRAERIRSSILIILTWIRKITYLFGPIPV